MNIVLIGMPGCGKSTVGVLVAKALLYSFVDVDLIIQNKYNKTLSDIIFEEGIEEFKRREDEVLSSLNFENHIIATGGSAVYSENGMKNLKNNGLVIYLKLSPEEIISRIKNIKTRGIVMEKGMTIFDLYNERAPLYEKYADITLDCEGTTVEECVKLIADAVKKPRV